MKRWTIRILLILLLLFFATEWVLSHHYRHDFFHQASHGHSVVILNSGEIIFGSYASGGTIPPDRCGWSVDFSKSAGVEDRQEFLCSAKYHFAGFLYTPQSDGFMASIPFYFPTLLAATLLLWTWHKTRPKSSRHAFPVEPN